MSRYEIHSVHAPLLDDPLRFGPGEVLQMHRRSVSARLHPVAGAIPSAELVTFAVPALGQGPLGVLVAGSWPPPDLAPGDRVLPTSVGWQVGAHALVVAGAAPWIPPAAPVCAEARWPVVRVTLAAELAKRLDPAALGSASALGLVAHRRSDWGAAGSFAMLMHEQLAVGCALLQEALLQADAAALAIAARRLVGVGGGLTPAGDDLLTGLLTLLLRAGHPLAAALFPVALAAESATTPVAAHMLRWATRGVVNAHLLAMADAAVAGAEELLVAALPAALAHGASSGADFAAGVWLGLGV